MPFMNSISQIPTMQRMPINFAPIPGVTQMGADAFVTPQQRTAMTQGQAKAPATPAGGVPGEGGGGAPAEASGGGGGIMGSITNALGGGGGGDSQLIQSIMKFLAMGGA